MDARVPQNCGKMEEEEEEDTIFESVQPYDPDDGDYPLKLFFYQLELIASLAHWNDMLKILVAKSRMVGVARDYVYSGLMTGIIDYATFKSNLMQQFQPPKHPVLLEREFRTCVQRPGENPGSYATRLEVLADEMFAEGLADPEVKQAAQRIRDERVYQQFAQGVLDPFARRFLAMHRQSLSDAIITVRSLELEAEIARA